jgi:type II secretion system protein N
MPAIKKQNLLWWGGCAAFFLLCFVVFAYLTFPYERVRDLLVSKVQASNTPGAPVTKLSIGELGPNWLTGVVLTSVALERSAETPGDPPTRLTADELKLRAAPFKLLFGGMGVHFTASAGEGDVTGSYDASKEGPTHVQAELDALDLARVGIGSLLGLPLAGEASGTLDVTLSDKPAETQGNVDLRIEHVKIGDAKGAKLKVPGMGSALTIDTIDAGTLELKMTIKDGVATIERFESKGKDLDLNGSGTIRLARDIVQSRADLTIGAKFEDAYRKKSDRTRSMFEIMSMQHIVGTDGALRLRVTGLLNALRSMPAGPAAAATAKPRAGSRAKHE